MRVFFRRLWGWTPSGPICHGENSRFTSWCSQTAYQIQVGPTAKWLAAARAMSGTAVGSNRPFPRLWPYGGSALRTEQTFILASFVWDQNGKHRLLVSRVGGRPGFSIRKNWKAKWIGYEESELRQVRESGAVWITNADTEAPKEAEKTNHDFGSIFFWPSLSGAARCM